MVVGPPLAARDFFYYFAYGSNMLRKRLNVQIKNAVFVNVGILRNYDLGFYDHSTRWNGALASIDECEGAEVWGCVWKIPDAYAEELDLQESGYRRLQVNIETKDQVVSCRTYQYLKECKRPASPSPHYKNVIVSGAVEHSIPSYYIEKLLAMKDNGHTELLPIQHKMLD